METEFTLDQIFQLLLKRLILILALGTVAAIGAAVVSWQFMDDIYQASSSVIVSSSKESDASQPLTYTDYTLNVKLVNSYTIICKTNRVLDQVISKLDLRMSTAQLSSKISVSSVDDTEIIHISVKDEDPVLAQNITNTLTEVFQKEVKEIMKMDNVQIIDPAPLPLAPIEPNRVRNVLLGALVGLAAGIALAFLLEYLDRSVKTEEQAEELLGIPVLGAVPKIAGS